MTITLTDVPLETLAGEPTGLNAYLGHPLLVVNVASQCGLTPQYAQLQELYDRYHPAGLEILAFPCNQFGSQEPGTADEIAQFCSSGFGVTFPLFAKTDVNGPQQHALYAELTRVADDAGEAGDVQWNFEKFLIEADGTVSHRFRPRVEPLSEQVLTAVEHAVAAAAG